jgi:hypothetical protein
MITIEKIQYPNVVLNIQTIKVKIVNPCPTTIFDSVYAPDITYCIGSPTLKSTLFPPKNSASLVNQGNGYDACGPS